MARKKKLTFEPVIKDVATKYIGGIYGTGKVAEKRINDLGFGNIYHKVIECAKLLKAGKKL